MIVLRALRLVSNRMIDRRPPQAPTFLAAILECRAVFSDLTVASIFVTNLTFCAFLRLIYSMFAAREAGFRPINGHQRSIFRTHSGRMEPIARSERT